MTNFFKEPNDSVKFYRIDDDGQIYTLNIYNGEWENITDIQHYYSNWEQVNEEYVDAFRLFIYVEQSNLYFQKHKKEIDINEYQYGDDFKFFITDKEVQAVDENNRLYLCTPKIMLPRMSVINQVPEDWVELELAYAIDYIENQEGIFTSNMDMYFDDNSNVQGYLEDGRQFCLDLNTGELNQVFDVLPISPSWKPCHISDPLFDDPNNEILLTVKQYDGLLDLHDYLEDSKEENEETNPNFNFGTKFNFFINEFDRVIAIDENNVVYSCGKLTMNPTNEEINLDSFSKLPRYLAVEKAYNYINHKLALPTKKITIQDLFLLTNDNHEVIGFTEDNRWYYMSLETGELISLNSTPKLDNSWIVISRGEGVILQGIVLDLYEKSKNEK